MDREYRSLTESGRLEQLQQSHDRRERDLSELRRAQKSVNRDSDPHRYSQLSSAIDANATILREDQEQIKGLEDLRERYLTTALKHYATALTFGDGHEEIVFRLISLWFAQHANDKVNLELRPFLEQVPSWKLVRAAHQLCARLHKSPGPEPTPFQALLSATVVRLCRDHPFHTLFKILALRFALPVPGSRSRRVSSMQAPQVTGSQLSQAHAADEVVAMVKKDAKLAILAGHVERAFAAYHEWADFDARNDKRFTADLKRKSPMTIPSHFAILALRDLPIPVTTIELPVDKLGAYPPERLPCIMSFDPRFVIPGGLRGPKMTTCLASDGRQYRALVRRLSRSVDAVDAADSSRAATTCDKTRSWSKSSSSSTVCCARTKNARQGTFAYGRTRSFRSRPTPASSSTLATRRRSTTSSSRSTTGPP